MSTRTGRVQRVRGAGARSSADGGRPPAARLGRRPAGGRERCAAGTAARRADQPVTTTATPFTCRFGVCMTGKPSSLPTASAAALLAEPLYRTVEDWMP